MALRGAPTRAGRIETDTTERAWRNEAPLTIRIKEPAGSAMQRDVRLQVDYFSGTVEDKAGRVMACLLETAEGRSLSDDDQASLKLQLGDWLSRNATALLTGGTLPKNPTKHSYEESSDGAFVFQRSTVCEPDLSEPPARPLPEAEPSTPPPVAEPSAASRAVPRRMRK